MVYYSEFYIQFVNQVSVKMSSLPNIITDDKSEFASKDTSHVKNQDSHFIANQRWLSPTRIIKKSNTKVKDDVCIDVRFAA